MELISVYERRSAYLQRCSHIRGSWRSWLILAQRAEDPRSVLGKVDTIVDRYGDDGDQLSGPWHVASALAHWSPSISLPDWTSSERIPSQPGVYVIRKRGHGICYIGMSVNLKRRLGTYASGKSGNPVDRITADHLTRCSAHERRLYHCLSPAEQQSWRRQWMADSGLRVSVAYTQDELQAAMLEKALIRLYHRHGAVLWNKINYVHTPPFAAPKVVA